MLQLHSVLAIGQSCRSQPQLWHTLSDKLWGIYQATIAVMFIERLRTLQAWAIGQVLPEPVLEKILNLSVFPFEELNGFYYHSNWLRNFLIAASLNGRGGGQFKKHTISQN